MGVETIITERTKESNWVGAMCVWLSCRDTILHILSLPLSLPSSLPSRFFRVSFKRFFKVTTWVFSKRLFVVVEDKEFMLRGSGESGGGNNVMGFSPTHRTGFRGSAVVFC